MPVREMGAISQCFQPGIGISKDHESLTFFALHAPTDEVHGSVIKDCMIGNPIYLGTKEYRRVEAFSIKCDRNCKGKVCDVYRVV